MVCCIMADTSRRWLEGPVVNTAVIKRSIVLHGRKTSISLENEFWDALVEVAKAREISIPALVEEIDRHRNTANLSSAIRVFVFGQQRTTAVGARHRQIDSQNLHARAEECRTAAETFIDTETRAAMLRIADAYERLAARLDRSMTAEH